MEQRAFLRRRGGEKRFEKKITIDKSHVPFPRVSIEHNDNFVTLILLLGKKFLELERFYSRMKLFTIRIKFEAGEISKVWKLKSKGKRRKKGRIEKEAKSKVVYVQ